MSRNFAKGTFMVDRSGKYFIFTNNLCIKKGHSVCFSLSIVNEMLVCRPFKKFRKASKCFGEVNKTKISLTYRW